jgi:hypothetical protein
MVPPADDEVVPVGLEPALLVPVLLLLHAASAPAP